VGLSADLLALGPALEPEEAQWGDPEVPTAWLCPRLRTTYSPRVSWAEWKGFGQGPAGPSGPEWSRVWEPGPTAAALGLSLARNSKTCPRYGLQGLPAAGRKQVWRALALLEEMRPLLSFWTISLPTESLNDLARADALPVFQDRVRKELSRLLRAAGLPDLVVGVAELQPKRSRAEGRPCPHWHIVFQGRRNRQTPWALSREQLDGVILAALASAGVRGPDLRSAGNVQRVKRSVRAYLSKYMTKGSGDCAAWVGGPHEALIPRQWWFWTRRLRAWVLRHVLPVAFPFLAWVHEHRQQLEALGLARWRLLELSDPRAPVTFEVNWLDCERVAQLIGLWQTDSWDAEWERNQRSLQWQPSRLQTFPAALTPMSA
jgi:hypothetical protein